MFFLMTIAAAVLLQKVYLYQTLNPFEVPPKGHIWDFGWGILAAIVFHVQFKKTQWLEIKGH